MPGRGRVPAMAGGSASSDAVREAHSLFREREWAKARRRLCEKTAGDASSAQARGALDNNLGLVLGSTTRLRQTARALLARALGDDAATSAATPEAAEAKGKVHFNLGLLALGEGDHRAALSHFLAALATMDDDPAVWLRLFQCAAKIAHSGTDPALTTLLDLVKSGMERALDDHQWGGLPSKNGASFANVEDRASVYDAYARIACSCPHVRGKLAERREGRGETLAVFKNHDFYLASFIFERLLVLGDVFYLKSAEDMLAALLAKISAAAEAGPSMTWSDPVGSAEATLLVNLAHVRSLLARKPSLGSHYKTLALESASRALRRAPASDGGGGTASVGSQAALSCVYSQLSLGNVDEALSTLGEHFTWCS